ncbi:hypothetical protein Q4493_12575 [Colwellia sp. 1_MG-2023]|uniref:hypothetical protein n=1 Tax=Colwellia sp. 1_MG-2023 TaxID=3062649 RepID=UPI0026E46981|nr:hypothetical protein [Colwellia sp. 1_MG-2023]MDO6446611.1 hypothetical protein [Colwellia sp. 1_MG-2023]
MQYKLVLIILGVLFSCDSTKNAEAALIQSDYVNYGDNLAVYDEATNLTWLDLSVTDGKAYENALTPHNENGFSYANGSQVTQLFLSFFGESVSYNSPGYSTGNTVLAQKFSSLFGLTSASSSFGFYFDNENKFSLFGVTLGGGKVYSPEFPVDYSKYYDTGNSGVGTYLVREGRITLDEPVITAYSPRLAPPLSVSEPTGFITFIFGILGVLAYRRVSLG